ncbi:MAG: YfhO family protein [Thermoanaerobaculia bacterium]
MRDRAISLALAALAFVPFAGMLLRGEVPAFRDHETYFLPLRWHTAAAVRAGDLPLWNAWSGLGEPWLANPQTAVFYPPAWIFFFLPFETAYVLFLAGHVALLGVTARRLFLRWTGDPAATFGAVALMLSGPVFSLLDVNNNLASFAWMPLALRLAFERRAALAPRGVPDESGAAVAPGGRMRSGVAIGGVLALAFLGGEPVYAAIAALLVAAALGSRGDWRGVASAGAWSIALSAVQLFPFLGWIAGSERAAGLDAPEAFRHSMRVGDWIALAMPFASTDGFERLRIGQQFIPSLYVGAPTVILALAAGLGSLRAEAAARRRILAMLLLTFAAVMALSALPAYAPLRDALVAVRANAIRYPARLVPIGALVVAALAAIGLDRLRKEPLGSRLGVTFWIALLVGLRFLTVEPLGRETAVLRFAIFLGWVIVFGLVYVGFPRWLEDRRVAALLIALVAADLLWSSSPLRSSRPFVASSGAWGEVLEGPWRFTRVESTRGAARDPDPDRWLVGYANLYERRFDFATPAPVVAREALAYYETAITGDRDDLVDAASVRWITTDRRRMPPGYAPAGAAVDGVRLFVNRGALPTVRFVPEPSAPEVVTEAFDPAQRMNAAAAAIVPMRFALAFDGRSATARVDAPSRGTVVLAQLAAPGWRVTVDGEPRAPRRANGIFRAVGIEAGAHVIRWSYRPRSLVAGALVTLGAVIALTLVAWRRRISPSIP